MRKCSYCKSRVPETERAQCNRCLEKRRQRYAEDPEYREKAKKASRLRNQNRSLEGKCAYCKSRPRDRDGSYCSFCYDKAQKRQATEEFKARNTARVKRAYWRDPDKARLNRRLFGFKQAGVDIDEARRYLEIRAGVEVCDICQSECPTGKALALDHCHDTKQIRGLLCANCNQGLGKFKDSIKLLEGAIDYLNRK